MYEKAIIFNSLIYSVWCFYFSRQILKERFTPVKTAVIILLTHVVIILGGRRLFPNGIPFILVHTASILSIFLWHYGSVKRKLLTYCLYTGMAMLLEMLIMSLFSFAQRLLYHRLSSMIGEISVQTSTDLIILSIIFLIVGSPMCKIIADFTGCRQQIFQYPTYSTDYLSLLLVLHRIIHDLRLQCSFRIVPVSFCCYNSSGRSDLYFRYQESLSSGKESYSP